MNATRSRLAHEGDWHTKEERLHEEELAHEGDWHTKETGTRWRLAHEGGGLLHEEECYTKEEECHTKRSAYTKERNVTRGMNFTQLLH